jgi:hypothetical protein
VRGTPKFQARNGRCACLPKQPPAPAISTFWDPMAEETEREGAAAQSRCVPSWLHEGTAHSVCRDRPRHGEGCQWSIALGSAPPWPLASSDLPISGDEVRAAIHRVARSRERPGSGEVAASAIAIPMPNAKPHEKILGKVKLNGADRATLTVCVVGFGETVRRHFLQSAIFFNASFASASVL